MTDDSSTDPQPAWRQAAQHHYDPEGGVELTTAIVTAVAEARGVSPTEVVDPPLYEVVDVPAIEAAFFGPGRVGVSRAETGRVEFHYADYLVRVESDGWIRVREPATPDEPRDEDSRESGRE